VLDHQEIGSTGPLKVVELVAREPRSVYRASSVEELAALARGENADLDESIVDQVMKALDSAPPGALTSLYYDLIHSKRLEVESLQGDAVRLGERQGIPTPMLFAAYALLRPHRDGSAGSA
jgi:ketopantoate reductase